MPSTVSRPLTSVVSVAHPVRLGGLVLVRADVDRVDRAAVVGLLRRHRRRRDDLVGRLDVEPRQRLREQDHAEAEPQEQDRRVRHLVAEALDAVEQPLHARVLGGRPRRSRDDRVGHGRQLQRVGVLAEERGLGERSPSRARRAARARRARGCSRSRRSRRRAAPRPSGTAACSALTSGIDPPPAALTAGVPQAAEQRRARRLVGRPGRCRRRSRCRSPRRGTSSAIPNGRTASRWRDERGLRLARVLRRMHAQVDLRPRVRRDRVERVRHRRHVDARDRDRRARPDARAEPAGALQRQPGQDLGELAELVVAVGLARPLLAVAARPRPRRRCSSCSEASARSSDQQRVGRGAAELAAVLGALRAS